MNVYLFCVLHFTECVCTWVTGAGEIVIVESSYNTIMTIANNCGRRFASSNASMKTRMINTVWSYAPVVTLCG